MSFPLPSNPWEKFSFLSIFFEKMESFCNILARKYLFERFPALKMNDYPCSSIFGDNINSDGWTSQTAEAQDTGRYYEFATYVHSFWSYHCWVFDNGTLWLTTIHKLLLSRWPYQWSLIGLKYANLTKSIQIF